MAELAGGHHLHELGDRVGLLAGDDLAGHDLRHRLLQHARTALTEHAHDVALRQDAFEPALVHHQHRADLLLGEQLDCGSQLRVGLDAHDLVALGIEDGTYRHCRLPESEPSALRGPDLFAESSTNSFGAGFTFRRFAKRSFYELAASEHSSSE